MARYARVEKRVEPATKEIYYAVKTSKTAGNIIFGHFQTEADAIAAAAAYRTGKSYQKITAEQTKAMY